MADDNGKINGLTKDLEGFVRSRVELWDERWGTIESFHTESRRDFSELKEGVTALQQIHNDTKHLSALPAIKEILSKLEGKLVDSATRKQGFETKDIALILALS